VATAASDLGAIEAVIFDLDGDHRRFVAGKPRYEGVSSFLGSRGIELPQGSPDDPEEREEREEREVRTAIVSSSRNCAAVLKAAGIGGLFDAKVDVVDAAGAEAVVGDLEELAA
jgi:trehalose 6-phosphate phosphatase